MSSDEDIEETGAAVLQPPDRGAAATAEASYSTATAGTRQLHCRVTDIDSALDPDNYDPYEPTTQETYVVQVTKKTRTEPERKVTWATQIPAEPAGRQGRANVMRRAPGVSGQEAMAARDQLHAWCFFFS